MKSMEGLLLASILWVLSLSCFASSPKIRWNLAEVSSVGEVRSSCCQHWSAKGTSATPKHAFAPGNCEAFLLRRSTIDSMRRLRGGSNAASETNSKKDHRKKRKGKQEEAPVADKPDDLSSDGDTEDEAQIEEKERRSKLFLMDPFRMNEMAHYEASLERDGPKDTTVESGETDGIASQESSGKEDNETEEESKGTKKIHDKHRKKKRNKSKIKAENETEIQTVESKDAGDSQDIIHFENTTTIDSKEANETGDESNSYWWVDVWTQHLSDPEDIAEEEIHDVGAEILEPGTSIEESDGNEIIEDQSKDENVPKLGRDASKRNSRRRKEERLRTDANTKMNEANRTVSETSESPSVLLETNSSNAVVNENESLPSETSDNTTIVEVEESLPKSYISSGAWVPIDNLLTIGLASKFSALRLSRKIRGVRKLSARITGLHGVLSGKPLASKLMDETSLSADVNMTDMDEESIQTIQKQIAAIDKARERVERAEAEEKARRRKRSFFGFGPRVNPVVDNDVDVPLGESVEEEPEEPKIPPKSQEEIEEEFQRMERVREIDMLIAEGQKQLAELICEKDVLQRRPNPLFNYTTVETVVEREDQTNNLDSEESIDVDTNATSRKVEIQATRKMNFPPDDLVAEYLDMMLSTRRLVKMNHTQLWRENEDEDDDVEEESIGDDLFTASADVHRLYEGSPSSPPTNGNGKRNGKKSGGGSWFLRQSIGNGPTLGEKIGQAAETAAYKAVTAALMSFLARTISSLHGINVMKHSDIRLFLEQSPDLPPVPKDGIIRGNHKNYAEETIKNVMRRKSRRSKKRSSKRRLSDSSFVQQEAVTETLLSHVQISAPLLKLFPLAWQRALLGNIIALSCALISDFLDGLHFQILGHELSFAFRPITEVDMARHFQMAGGRFNQRRYKAAEFEAAIQATAEDLKEELKFLDSWHERALGSGVLRTQIADMIARIVLTLTDDVLSGARMDLWSAQAGGPRMLAGLEHRIEDES